MKKFSDDLFQLIKSLTKSEKGYFKKYVVKSAGRKSNYLKLFEAISGQEEYDEKELKKGLAGENFVKYLSSEKKYLYELILKGLNAYHAEVSSKTRLKHLLLNVEILYGKGLFRQCEKLIARARQQARKFEDHAVMLEVLKWERTMVANGTDPVKLEKFIGAYREEMNQAIGKLQQTVPFLQSQDRAYLLYLKAGALRNEADVRRIMGLVPGLVPENVPEDQLTYEAKESLFNTRLIHSYLTSDMQSSYRYSMELLKHNEAHPHRIKESPYGYIHALYIHLFHQMELGKYDELFATIKRLRAIRVSTGYTESIQSLIFRYSYSLELIAYLRRGEFRKGIDLMPEIEKGLHRFRHNISSLYKLEFYIYISQLYFGSGQYNKALAWINKVIHIPDLKLREDIHCLARVFQLLIHYELKNMDLLEYIVKSTYRFLHQRERLYELEKLVLDFIKAAPRLHRPQELAGYLGVMREKAIILSRNPFERKAFGFFDFISWIESKTGNKSFEEVVRSKMMH